MSYNNLLDPTTVVGNITARLSNALPTDVMSVGGLFEISMPANTDVRIRALVPRSVYLLSEGEYPGGSFSTGTAAPVNLTTAFVAADNNVHVAGERNVLTIQDILTNRIFQVTVWRFGAIAGNWSGWVEEIGATTNSVVTAPYLRAQGTINITDFTTAATVVAETTTGITATVVSGSGTSPMVMQVNLPAGLLPDALYKVLPVISSNVAELATAQASVVCEIAAGRAPTNFRVIFRETISAQQNCNFEFVIFR